MNGKVLSCTFIPVCLEVYSFHMTAVLKLFMALIPFCSPLQDREQGDEK